MTRKTVDIVVSTIGLVAAVALIVVGVVAWVGHDFIDTQVHNQLASQKIFFPPKGSPAIAGPQFAPMRQYAGQQLVTGQQAKTYADHFIGVHLSEVAGGKTYAQVSAAALADPKNATLQGQADTLFKGTTLRGLLLNAYAFGTTARLVADAAIVMWIAGGVLLVLSILGYVHASRETAAGTRVEAVGQESAQARAA